jgi:hypothetical protein
MGENMIYEILNDAGEVVNTIIADEVFVETHHAGRYRLVGPEPVADPPTPPKTEEEKLAEATAAAIAKLIADGVLKQA